MEIPNFSCSTKTQQGNLNFKAELKHKTELKYIKVYVKTTID